mmetsp:Transcript_3336/g.7746  ORF Transcript_3336/g.7746 Transcript_3336/m.7746 type:complete len:222 (-) Transcript_3336:1427-2092(-)
MSSRIMCGMQSASLSTGKSLAEPDSLPTYSAAKRENSPSPSSLAYRPTKGFPGDPEPPFLSGCDSVDPSSSRACSADFSRSRVVKPMQKPEPFSTGKSTTSLASSAFLTTSRGAFWGRMASEGSRSHRNFAGMPSMLCGSSGWRKGIFFRLICSSSKPRSLMSLFKKSDTATLTIKGGMRLRSLAQPLMKMTTATDICLKPQSIAALPIIAYTPVTAVPPI